jgi:hypothetical protein
MNIQHAISRYLPLLCIALWVGGCKGKAEGRTTRRKTVEVEPRRRDKTRRARRTGRHPDSAL